MTKITVISAVLLKAKLTEFHNGWAFWFPRAPLKYFHTVFPSSPFIQIIHFMSEVFDFQSTYYYGYGGTSETGQ